jgi:hypothetical protein
MHLPTWWQWVRRVTIFGLGVGVIIEGFLSQQDRVVELIAGLVMIGVLPLDDLLRTFSRTYRRGLDAEAEDH